MYEKLFVYVLIKNNNSIHNKYTHLLIKFTNYKTFYYETVMSVTRINHYLLYYLVFNNRE